MLIYNVEITIEPGIEAEWLDWMKKVHVPDVVRTGCFSHCQIYQLLGGQRNEPTYILQYHCESLETYHRYQDQFAPRLQKEHSERYAGQFRGARRLLQEV